MIKQFCILYSCFSFFVQKTTVYWVYWSVMPHTLHTESGKKISVVVSIHKQDQIVYLLPPVSEVFFLMGSHKIIFNSLEWMRRVFLSSLQVIRVLFKIIVVLVCVPQHMVTLSSTWKTVFVHRRKLFSFAEGDIAKCTPLNINTVNYKKS